MRKTKKKKIFLQKIQPTDTQGYQDKILSSKYREMFLLEYIHDFYNDINCNQKADSRGQYNMLFYLSYISFVIEKKKLKILAFTELIKIQKNIYITRKERYFLNVLYSKANQLFSNQQSIQQILSNKTTQLQNKQQQQSSSDLQLQDLFIGIRYDEGLNAIEKLFIDTLDLKLQFLKIISTEYIDLKKIQNIAISYLSKRDLIAKLIKDLSMINQDSQKLKYYVDNFIHLIAFVVKRKELIKYTSRTDAMLRHQLNRIDPSIFQKDNCVIFVSMIDKIGTVTRTQNKIFNILGYQPQEILGKNINIFMPKFIRQYHTNLILDYNNINNGDLNKNKVNGFLPLILARNQQGWGVALSIKFKTDCFGLNCCGYTTHLKKVNPEYLYIQTSGKQYQVQLTTQSVYDNMFFKYYQNVNDLQHIKIINIIPILKYFTVNSNLSEIEQDQIDQEWIHSIAFFDKHQVLDSGRVKNINHINTINEQLMNSTNNYLVHRMFKQQLKEDYDDEIEQINNISSSYDIYFVKFRLYYKKTRYFSYHLFEIQYFKKITEDKDIVQSLQFYKKQLSEYIENYQFQKNLKIQRKQVLEQIQGIQYNNNTTIQEDMNSQYFKDMNSQRLRESQSYRKCSTQDNKIKQQLSQHFVKQNNNHNNTNNNIMLHQSQEMIIEENSSVAQKQNNNNNNNNNNLIQESCNNILNETQIDLYQQMTSERRSLKDNIYSGQLSFLLKQNQDKQQLITHSNKQLSNVNIHSYDLHTKDTPSLQSFIDGVNLKSTNITNKINKLDQENNQNNNNNYNNNSNLVKNNYNDNDDNFVKSQINNNNNKEIDVNITSQRNINKNIITELIKSDKNKQIIQNLDINQIQELSDKIIQEEIGTQLESYSEDKNGDNKQQKSIRIDASSAQTGNTKNYEKQKSVKEQVYSHKKNFFMIMITLFGFIALMTILCLTIFQFISVTDNLSFANECNSFIPWPMSIRSEFVTTQKQDGLLKLAKLNVVPDISDEAFKEKQRQVLRQSINNQYALYNSYMRSNQDKLSFFAYANTEEIQLLLSKDTMLIPNIETPNPLYKEKYIFKMSYFIPTFMAIFFQMNFEKKNDILNQIMITDNFPTFNAKLVLIQDQIQSQTEDILSKIKFDILLLLVLVITATLIIIGAVFPIYYFVQSKNQLLLQLFSTVSFTHLKFMIQPILFFLRDQTNLKSSIFAESVISKRRTISETSSLQKFKPIFVFYSIICFGVILVQPITNYVLISQFNTQSLEIMNLLSNLFIQLILYFIKFSYNLTFKQSLFIQNQIQNNLYYLIVKFYDMRAQVISNLGVHYQYIAKRIDSRTLLYDLKYFQNRIPSLQKQNAQKLTDMLNLIASTYENKKYQQEYYDHFFSQIFEGDICQATKDFPQFIKPENYIDYNECSTIRKGMLKRGFELNLKAFLQVFTDLVSIYETKDQQKFLTALIEYEKSVNLKEFDEFSTILLKVIDIIKDFLLQMLDDQTKYTKMIQEILVIYQIIILIVVFTFGWLRFYYFISMEMYQIKTLLSILQIEVIIENPYIQSHLNST